MDDPNLTFARRGPPDAPPGHPGRELTRLLRQKLGLSITDAARRLGVSRSTLHRILAGSHGVSAEMALRLHKLTGKDAAAWMAMQSAHDLEQARARLEGELERITPPRPTGRSAELRRRPAR